MSATQTISASEFKAKCLKILDQLANHELDHVTITKRGKAVGILTAPQPQPEAVPDIYGFMRGSVIIPEGYDLTEPVLDEPFDAELGIVHR
jgi:hypothetical protein